MFREDTEELWEKYEALFDSSEKKAAAFDKIARNYYLGNFGSMSKTDLDVLMFSLLLEEILGQTEDDISTYSDYALAKQLGITQSRVSNLKLKKHLQYPYKDFDWRVSFKRCCGNARLDSGKIRINLRDVNLYYELRNEIEEKGGYAEASLTRNLLIITPEDFFTLTTGLMTQEEQKTLKEKIRKQYAGNTELLEKMEREPLPKALKSELGSSLPDILFEIVKAFTPGAASIGIEILQTALKSIMKNK